MITHHFNILNFINREPEELWNELKDIFKDKCEKISSKMKKQMKGNWMSKKNVEIAKKKTEAKANSHKRNLKYFRKLLEETGSNM